MDVIELARSLNIDPSHLSKWERGLVPVPADQIPRIDTVLKAERHITAVHAAVAELEERRARERATLEVTTPAETDDQDVKRRNALQLIAALGAGTAIPPGLLEDALSGIEYAISDHTDVDEWDRAVWEHGYQLLRQPPGALIGDLTADAIAVGQVLQRRCPPLVKAGLLRASSGLSALLAIECGDTGDERSARIAWATARRTADASGDRDLAVWVRAREAAEAFWTMRPDPVVEDLTSQAVKLANNAPSAGLAQAHAVRARLAAKHGDAPSAHTALGEYARTFERLPERTIGGRSVSSVPMTFREFNLYFGSASVQASIGDTAQAHAALDQATALLSTDEQGDLSNVGLIRAIALVQDREIDQGIDQAASIVHGKPLSATRRYMTRQVLGALPDKARALPAARELRVAAGT
jgi:DNA-binding transcriptional regulator YdaS (Cro superfamily)